MTISSPISSSFTRSSRFRTTAFITILDSIEEVPEYDSIRLNLGTESPGSILIKVTDEDGVEDEWAKSGIAVDTNVPMRDPNWRSSSFSKKRGRKLKKELVDRDCGICFEVSITPCRTTCCGQLFCLEHITDWLYGPSSDGRCPSCQSLCSLERDTLPLPSPILDYPPLYEKSRTLVPSPVHSSTEILPTPMRTLPPNEDNTSLNRSLELGPSYLSSDTLDILSRLTSIVGLTLFLYVLLS